MSKGNKIMINNKLNFNEFCSQYFINGIDLSNDKNMNYAIVCFNDYLSSNKTYRQWRLLLNSRG